MEGWREGAGAFKRFSCGRVFNFRNCGRFSNTGYSALKYEIMKVKKHKSGGNSLNVQSILQADISFSQKNLKQMQNINHLASYRVAI